MDAPGYLPGYGQHEQVWNSIVCHLDAPRYLIYLGMAKINRVWCPFTQECVTWMLPGIYQVIANISRFGTQVP